MADDMGEAEPGLAEDGEGRDIVEMMMDPKKMKVSSPKTTNTCRSTSRCPLRKIKSSLHTCELR